MIVGVVIQVLVTGHRHKSRQNNDTISKHHRNNSHSGNQGELQTEGSEIVGSSDLRVG